MYPLRLRALTAIGIAAALLFVGSGCSRKSDPVAESISTLAASGVAVYESYSAKSPIEAPKGTRSAMRLTRWQLSNLLTQARAGGGLSGTMLDKMAEAKTGKTKIGFSYIVAAWLAHGGSDLAKYGRQFMPANADFKHAPKLTYSLLVLTLFIADIARMKTAPASTGFDFEPFLAERAAADGICSTVTGFIDTVIQDVINALTFDNEGNSTIIDIFNTIVTFVVGTTLAAIKAALAPIFKVISAIVGAISVIAMVASTLQTWHLKIEATPEKVTLGDQPVEGKLVAQLDAPSLPVPSDVVDCASALGGVDLNTVNFKDAPVTWTPSGEIPGNVDVISKQATVGDDKTATLTYRTHTVQSTPEPQCATEQFVGEIFTSATVEREDVFKLEQALTNALLNQLPSGVASVINPILDPFVKSAQKSFQNIISSPVTATGFAQLSEMKNTCTPTPSPTPSPGASPQPSGSSDSDIVGTWQCEITGIISLKATGDMPQHVGIEITFMKNGVGTDAQGTGHYKYVSTGMSSGSLSYPRGTVPVTWKSHDAFTSPLIDPPNGKNWRMACTRE